MFCKVSQWTKKEKGSNVKILHWIVLSNLAVRLFHNFLLRHNMLLLASLHNLTTVLFECKLPLDIILIQFPTWDFFICFNANDLFLTSPAIWTSSTRPKPPTPRVAMMRRSPNFRLLNSSWILKSRTKIKLKIQRIILDYIYMAFLWVKSMYLFFMTSKFEMSWWKDSRSITRQDTPSASSATILAVLFSSLLNIIIKSFNNDCKNLNQLKFFYPCKAFSPKKSPLWRYRMNFSSLESSSRFVTLT